MKIAELEQVIIKVNYYMYKNSSPSLLPSLNLNFHSDDQADCAVINVEPFYYNI